MFVVLIKCGGYDEREGWACTTSSWGYMLSVKTARGSVCVCVLERERELHVNKSTYGEALKCNWRFNEEKIRCSQIAMPIGGVCGMTKCVVNTAAMC